MVSMRWKCPCENCTMPEASPAESDVIGEPPGMWLCLRVRHTAQKVRVRASVGRLVIAGVEVAYVAYDRLGYVGRDQVEHAVHVGEAVDGLQVQLI